MVSSNNNTDATVVLLQMECFSTVGNNRLFVSRADLEPSSRWWSQAQFPHDRLGALSRNGRRDKDGEGGEDPL